MAETLEEDKIGGAEVNLRRVVPVIPEMRFGLD